MKKMLIGFTGFVGSNINKQSKFHSLYNSKNIEELDESDHSLCVCTAAPAIKWHANKYPEDDKKSIDSLIKNLEKINCNELVLISTVDVFKNPVMVDELTNVSKTNLHPYGLHRRELEEYVQSRFKKSTIVRLPGLVGDGLKKNVIYDLTNNNNLKNCNLSSKFQFYPLNNIWLHIKIALKNNIPLIHLTSEPISVSEIVENVFPEHRQKLKEFKINQEYDFRTIYGNLFNSNNCYQYSKDQSLEFIKMYKNTKNFI